MDARSVMPACSVVAVPPWWFAPSRPSALLSEVLFAWWAIGPDLPVSVWPVKPRPDCRAPCLQPCYLVCPLPAAPRVCSPGGGRPRAEGAGLNLSQGQHRTQGV